MAAFKCFHCRLNIYAVDGEWQTQARADGDDATCERSPDGKHARQVVLNLNKKEAA
jgi:hypothetical protein